MWRKLFFALGAVATLGIANACGSEGAVAPATEQRYGALDIVQTLGSVRSGIDTVVTVSRALLLPQDVTESAIIGPEGGTIELQESGGRITFPPGALTKPMRITMTAKAGWNVAYEFAPHGITFAVPVMVEQSLNDLLASQATLGLQVGYYADDLASALVGTRQSLARVMELRQVLLDRPTDPRVARFSISHFSGYIMSSGFAPGGGDGSGGGDTGSGQP